MSKLLLSSSAAWVLAALCTRAQSINIDFGPADSPYRTPPPSYGGSAQSPGVWNAGSSLTLPNLRKWDGSPTNVSFSITNTDPLCGGSSPFVAGTHGATSGEDEALLDDGLVDENFGWDATFTGLEPGDYTVDTIMVRFSGCFTPATISVWVTGSPDPEQCICGDWSGSYVQGTALSGGFCACGNSNFSRHLVTVTDGTIQIHGVHRGTFGDWMKLCGIQLEKDDHTFLGTFQCYGDGTGAACPCTNSGEPGLGCQNSVSTGGAFLYADGTTTPDTAVLHVTRELPASLTVFLQGNATGGPFAFGDGLRCATGTLKRLYVKGASGGAANAPSGSDPSITARSAALGDPIPAGERRYYQTYYRDPNPTFCGSPQGGTFNASNAVKIVW